MSAKKSLAAKFLIDVLLPEVLFSGPEQVFQGHVTCQN